MPSFSRRSRPGLLALARPLSRAARDLFPDPVIRLAADSVDEAVLGLDLEGGASVQSGQALSAEVALVIAEEESLDRRVGALGRLTDAFADLGDGEVEAVRNLLFPEGIGPLIAPSGRAQASVYLSFAERLADAARLPGAARLLPELDTLRVDLLAWAERAYGKDDVRRDRASRAASAQAATETLREALIRLDRTIALHTGGPTTDLYRKWAATADHLG